MADRRILHELTIEPGTGKALEVLRGQILRIEQVVGGQCADFNCFNLHDYKEFMHTGRIRHLHGLHPGKGDFLIRNLMGVDQKSGALSVGTMLRTGQLVQFHLRDKIMSAEDLNQLLSKHNEQAKAHPASGALMFSCMGRGQGLYGEADHDSRIFKNKMGDVPMGGFFCNGEIGPVGNATFLHGYTSSFGIFSPRDSAE